MHAEHEQNELKLVPGYYIDPRGINDITTPLVLNTSKPSIKWTPFTDIFTFICFYDDCCIPIKMSPLKGIQGSI